MPNQLENDFALTKSLINNMIDTLTANRQQSLSSTLMLLKEVTLLLNSYNTSSLDLSILASQMNTNSLSVNSQNFIAFYIIGINLSFYIKTIDKKYFTEYKKEKEKEKEPKRTKDKIKDQKQRMHYHLFLEFQVFQKHQGSSFDLKCIFCHLVLSRSRQY